MMPQHMTTEILVSACIFFEISSLAEFYALDSISSFAIAPTVTKMIMA